MSDSRIVQPTRREFVKYALAGVGLMASGCGGTSPSEPETNRSDLQCILNNGKFEGRYTVNQEQVVAQLGRYGITNVGVSTGGWRLLQEGNEPGIVRPITFTLSGDNPNWQGVAGYLTYGQLEGTGSSERTTKAEDEMWYRPGRSRIDGDMAKTFTGNTGGHSLVQHRVAQLELLVVDRVFKSYISKHVEATGLDLDMCKQ